ncbi:hypothetical protein [Kallipyga gabonensis]|uniref:hypothetical protein n=1 Tax=Kallipyga gabonensis TaxID=1686287 RepID=UPI0006B55BED|nr:hypothetical protein [Kallipyga gabonensis]
MGNQFLNNINQFLTPIEFVLSLFTLYFSVKIKREVSLALGRKSLFLDQKRIEKELSKVERELKDKNTFDNARLSLLRLSSQLKNQYGDLNPAILESCNNLAEILNALQSFEDPSYLSSLDAIYQATGELKGTIRKECSR